MLVGERVDSRPFFDWSYSTQSGIGLTSRTDWTARWTGYIKSPYTGWHTIRRRVDAQAQFYLSGQLLERLNTLGSVTYSYYVYLEANRLYDFQIDFKVNSQRQFIQMYWRPPNGVLQSIPTSIFYHTPLDLCACPVSVDPFNPTSPLRECGGTGRGYCNNGVCTCNNNFAGDACQFYNCIRDKCFGHDTCVTPAQGSIPGLCGGHG